MDDDFIEEDIEDFKVELVLDNETRIWELKARGPASLIKYFLVEGQFSVIDKLNEEIEFDKLIPHLTGSDSV